ncbi:MAG: hypothetical protein WDZ49_10385 [Litorilinea sp.]
MTNQLTPGNQNGKYEAPHYLNGASSASRHPVAPAQQRTIFPPDPTHADWRRPAYILDQFLFFGAPLRRFIVFLLVALITMALIGLLPGRWFTAALFTSGTIAFVWSLRRARSRQFVEFTAQTAPDPIPDRLPAADRIPVYVTGLCLVEGKFKRFTQLPGFYRTFATGEHAVLCLIRDRTVLKAGHWPEEDIGMWYVFFTPALIQAVNWGTLAFGPDRAPAVAVTYLLTIPAGNQNPRERTVEETVYIATQSNTDAQRILADLLWELPPTAQPQRTRQVDTAE